MASFETIFKEWDINKKTLFKLLDNNLIVRRPYTYIVPDEDLIKKIENCKYDIPAWNFTNWWNREVYAPVLNQLDLDPDFVKLCKDIIQPKTLANNKYPNETKIFSLPPDGELFKVSKGMRPMKIISKLAQKYGCDEKILEEFRIWHSQILNNKHMDGELCLSIHPLDYMTMSDNDNDWQSCMNWMNHGDYRCGTVECMNSPYILIAYLHNPKHLMSLSKVNNNKWNSKHWRELFIINPEMINEIKGYCFQDENLTNTVLMWIKELASKNLGWTYDDDEINIQETIPFKDSDLSFRIYTDGYMYNDIGTLDKHRARINREKIGKYENITHWYVPSEDKWHYMLEIPYGGKSTCMWCGQEINGTDREESVLCDSCDMGICCAYCGDYISKRNCFYIDDFDNPICENCLEYECGIDDLTEDSHLISNLIYIKWKIGEDERGEPIFFNNGFSTYLPEYNDSYKNIFKNPPKTYKHNYCINYYITTDDIIDRNQFKDIFMLDDTIDNVIAEYMQD